MSCVDQAVDVLHTQGPVRARYVYKLCWITCLSPHLLTLPLFVVALHTEDSESMSQPSQSQSRSQGEPSTCSKASGVLRQCVHDSQHVLASYDLSKYTHWIKD